MLQGHRDPEEMSSVYGDEDGQMTPTDSIKNPMNCNREWLFMILAIIQKGLYSDVCLNSVYILLFWQ